jgi:hypothetical protein
MHEKEKRIEKIGATLIVSGGALAIFGKNLPLLPLPGKLQKTWIARWAYPAYIGYSIRCYYSLA